MNKFKSILQRPLYVLGEALHQKPTRSLVALILCCAGVAHALAPAKDAATDRPNNPSLVESKAEGVTQNNEAIAALEKDLSERMNRLEERERQLYAQSLETSRKNIDWWLTAIGIGLTLFGLFVAIAGVLLPLYWQRAERSRLRQAQAEFDRMQNSAQETLTRLASIETKAEESKTKTEGHEKRAEELAASMATYDMSAFDKDSSKSNNGAANAEAIKAAREINQTDPKVSDVDKLRARAIQASQAEKSNFEQALLAYELWFSLSRISPSDAKAHFHAGYWAQELFNKNAMPSEQYWFDLLSRHYQEGLNIKPSLSARYNWSLALLKQAKSATPSELNKRKEMASEAEKLLSEIAESSDKNKTGMAPLLAEAYVLLGYFEKCVQQLEICRQDESLPVPVSSVLLGLDGPDWTFDDHEVHWEPLGNSVEFKAWKQQYFTDPAPSSA